MDELIERVSDIFNSPVILKRSLLCYRQFARLCLVIFIGLSLTPLLAQDNRVSRYQFVLAVYERVYNYRPTEVEAAESGLIDPFDDGQYNLDWPISRGMAAEGLYRLSQQLGTIARLPRAFADIGNDSMFKQPLAKVGGAFVPRNRGRFDPNYLLERETLFRAINLLLENEILHREERSRDTMFRAAEPVITTAMAGDNATASANADPSADAGELVSIRPDLGFKQHQGGDTRYRAQAYSRVAAANRQVSLGQMNPQEMANLNNAAAAMQDVEKLLDRLGGSIMEMTTAQPENPDDEKVLRRGLAQIEAVLATTADRFAYSKLQLGTAMPIDPDQVRRCEELNQQFDIQSERLKILRQRIAERLAEPQIKED